MMTDATPITDPAGSGSSSGGSSPSPLKAGWISILGLAGWLALCFGAAAVGAQFGPGSWYAALQKPSWNPPNWIFGPVWTFLYTAMAAAAWLVWRRGGWPRHARALCVFLFQLTLNALWSWLFFGLQRADLALLDIVLLWLAIGWTWTLFRPVSAAAGWLLVPYLGWVSFAAVLNGVLWRLNLA